MMMPKHCFHRLFEWSVSAMMIGIALTVMVSPHTISSGGFYLVQKIGLTAPIAIVFFLVTGALRVAALYANGHWPIYGPRCRAACALLGALIWAQMLVALSRWSVEIGYISMGVPVYACLAAGELISCYRAASDGRRH